MRVSILNLPLTCCPLRINGWPIKGNLPHSSSVALTLVLMVTSSVTGETISCCSTLPILHRVRPFNLTDSIVGAVVAL